ncbi:hypothetical protein ACSW8S_15080 (plasmid) [Clostridium perfringens]
MKKLIINKESKNKGKTQIGKTIYYLEDHISNPMEALEKSFTDFMISKKGQNTLAEVGATLTWNSAIDLIPSDILSANGIHVLNDIEISCSVNGDDIIFEKIQKKYL